VKTKRGGKRELAEAASSDLTDAARHPPILYYQEEEPTTTRTGKGNDGSSKSQTRKIYSPKTEEGQRNRLVLLLWVSKEIGRSTHSASQFIENLFLRV